MEQEFRAWLVQQGNPGAAKNYPQAIRLISEHYWARARWSRRPSIWSTVRRCCGNGRTTPSPAVINCTQWRRPMRQPGTPQGGISCST